MTLTKRIIFTVLFVAGAFLLPAVLLLLFVDSTEQFSTYVIFYGLIIFGTFGYILASTVSTRKNVETALEEIKMQNAAIAFKLTSVFKDNPEALDALLKEVGSNAADEQAVSEKPVEKEDSSRVSLNPDTPLVMPKAKAEKPFDDFN